MMTATDGEILPRTPWHRFAANESDPATATARSADGPHASPGLRVAAVRTFSATDFPGHRAAVLHCASESCGGESGRDYTWGAIEYFLHRWSGTLSGVVFGGEEPTAHADLPAAIARSRALGYAVALHTGGSEPDALSATLGLVDWVSLEVPVERGLSQPACWESLKRLLAAEVPLECRSFVRRGSHNRDQLLSLGRQLAASGVRRYTICLADEGQARRDGLAGWEALAAMFPEFRLQPA